jgi:hypothetical protein
MRRIPELPKLVSPECAVQPSRAPYERRARTIVGSQRMARTKSESPFALSAWIRNWFSFLLSCGSFGTAPICILTLLSAPVSGTELTTPQRGTSAGTVSLSSVDS